MWGEMVLAVVVKVPGKEVSESEMVGSNDLSESGKERHRRKGEGNSMIKKIRHVGIVLDNLERALEKFEAFGLPCAERKEDKEIGIRAGFLPVGDTSLEIINLTGEGKKHDPMIHLVGSIKGTINHLCFEVDDLESSIRDFESKGAKLIEGCPRPGAHGRIAFFYPETTENVLIELCQL